MKNILFIILSFLVLVGCAPKKEIIDQKPIEKPKEVSPLIEPDVIEPINEVIVEEIPEEIIIEDDGLNKIAVIFPSKIVGKYAKSTISTLNAFLLYKDVDFEIETFDTFNESIENIQRELSLINEKGFTKVIAMFTSNGFNVLNNLEESKEANFYLPLINKSEIITENQNFTFGGISYKNQFEQLQALSNDKNTMFYVKSYLGNKLRALYEETFFNPGSIKEIQRKNNRYKDFIDDERMIGDTIILNTPIVKTSIILNQLTAFEIEPTKVLSTQLNYNPILVKLTQQRDRKNFFIVSSISKVDDFLEEYVDILGADIVYNWVDYSTLVGANYLLFDKDKEDLIVENSSEEELLVLNEKVEAFEDSEELILEENQGDTEEESLVKTKVIDKQADYDITLYETTSYGFKKLEIN